LAPLLCKHDKGQAVDFVVASFPNLATEFMRRVLIIPDGVTTSTDSGFTAVTGASQYLIMPKHMSKELAEPMNINWKTSSIHRFENG